MHDVQMLQHEHDIKLTEEITGQLAGLLTSTYSLYTMLPKLTRAA